MKIIKFDASNDNLFKEVIVALKRGEVIVYPTDTVYGLGVNALDKFAVDRLFRMKKRAATKPLSVIVRDIKMARRFSCVNLRAEKILKGIWPGKVTVVLPKKDTMPSMVSGGKDTIGMRIPKHEFTEVLMENIDFPIVSTSVNFSGEPSLRKIGEIVELFRNEKLKPDLILDAGDLPESSASTVIDLTTSKPKVLRVGPARPDELLKILEI